MHKAPDPIEAAEKPHKYVMLSISEASHMASITESYKKASASHNFSSAYNSSG
jgi:hypothetical protein